MKLKCPPVTTLLKNNYRAVMLLEKYNPGLLLATTLNSVFPLFSKYANIYLSAQIINELAGARRVKTLFLWALITVLSNGLFSLLGAISNRWAYSKEELTEKTRSYITADKLLSMDFPDVDRYETRDKISQIAEVEKYLYRGLSCVIDVYTSFIDAFREKLRNGLFQCVYIVYFIVDWNNYRKLVFACLVHISANNFGIKYKYTRNPAFVKIKNRFSVPIELF